MTKESYTPTTDEVRAVWREWNGYGGLINRVGPEPTTRAGMVAEFDRWLAKVKADAWDACVSQAEACGYIGLNDASELESIFNPYRQGPQR